MKRIAALAMVPAALGGCVVAAAAIVAGAAVGTYAYIEGNALREYNATVKRCWNASLRACERMALDKPRGNPPTDQSGTLYSRRPADGATVKIQLDAKSPTRTQVGIRFGEFGDKALSEQFHTVLTDELQRR